MGKVFESYIFEENEIAANNVKASRMQPFLIRVIILLLIICFILLEFYGFVGFLLVIYFLIEILNFLRVFDIKRRTGQLRKKLKITNEGLFIDEKFFSFADLDSVKIVITAVEGQTVNDRIAVWKSNGTENSIYIQRKTEKLHFKFWIPNTEHRMVLRRITLPHNVSIKDLAN